MAIHALITAGGKGVRFNAGRNKAFAELLGKEMLYYSLKELEEMALIESIVLVVGQEDVAEAGKLCQKYSFKKVRKIVEGGKERQDSVWNGLKALRELKAAEEDLVLIHDGARPLITKEAVEAVIDKAKEFNAAVCGVPVKDTIKIIGKEDFILETPDRKTLWQTQTPQGMKFGLALQAFEKAFNEGFYGTDDVQLVERLGIKVKMVLGSYDNIKITTPDDLKVAEKILEHKIAFHEKDNVGVF
ncbi:2-C-methyl-D-erythritol 4-phosphate cytidylyltransferase [archaeon]|nr:2-C-methyl-D-erythritol 4-phosphate cytidylyltransferase [archaeon]